jgi:hypothetical protein
MLAWNKPKLVARLNVLWCCVWLYYHEIHIEVKCIATNKTAYNKNMFLY